MTDSGAGEVVASAPGSRLPEGWGRATLRELCESVVKVHPGELGKETFRYVDIGSIASGELVVSTAKEIPVQGAPSRARQLIQVGDTVFSTVRPYLKKIAWIPEFLDGEIASTGFCVLRPGEALEPRYLFHLVTSNGFVARVVEKQRGASYPAVREVDIFEEEVVVPPLSEQRRIVAKLDEQLARIEDGEAALVEARRQLELFEVMLLAKATKANPEASSWDCFAIGEMANVSSGATPLKAMPEYYRHGTVPWVTSSMLNDAYVDSADKFITDLALSETAVKEYLPGTILMAMYGEGKTRGKCAVLGIRATTNQACAGIELKPAFESSRAWVLAFLEALYEENREMASGGVQPNLSLGLIKKIRVPLPPVVRQKEILTELAERRSEAAAMREVIKDASAQAKSLRGALLHAAFTGVLVPQDPADEPADTLVDRIRTQRQAAAVKPVRKRAPRKTTSKPASSGQEELSL